MAKFRACLCRIECEEIALADGTRMFVCVTCETWAETEDGRLVALEEKRLPRRRRRADKTATR